jgi:hypothetical protein
LVLKKTIRTPSDISDTFSTHTTFWDWNVLNLDVKVWTLVDYYTGFTCLWDIKSLDFVFCHVVGMCVYVGLIVKFGTVAPGMKGMDLVTR